MTKSIIIYGFIAILVHLVLYYLKKEAGNQVAQSNGGLFILRMNKFYGIIGQLSIVLGFSISIMLFMENNPSLVLIAMMLTIFCAGGFYLLLWYLNHQLKFNDTIIEVTTIYGKTNSVVWSDIKNISFNHFSGIIAVSDNKGIEVKIHQHIAGLSSFIRIMEEKTTWTANQLKL